MEPKSWLRMLRSYKIKFCLISSGINIYHLLFDNSTCINSTKLTKFQKKEVTCISKMITLEEDNCNIYHYFSE